MADTRSRAKDGLKNQAVLYALTHAPSLWQRAQGIRPLEQRVNRWLINSGIKNAPPRPYRLSTLAPYTSWASLTDQTYNARQLPPRPLPAGLPPAEEVAELFRRETTIECPKSTVLFAYFAQWFTDGFLRSRRPIPPARDRDIRINVSTHEVDLTQLYGSQRKETEALRAHEGGLLKSESRGGEVFPPRLCDEHGQIKPEFDDAPTPIKFDEMEPELRTQLFAVGSDAANSQVGYAMLNVLFLREHNRIARELAARYPQWGDDDDRLFETARSILTVLLIKLAIEQYINHIAPYHFKFRLDAAGFYDQPWYRPNWMAVEFNLLYRWHSLIPTSLRVGGEDLPLEDTLNRTDLLTRGGLGGLFEDASRQPAGMVSLFNTAEWFRSRTEIPSIQHGRTAELGSYNDYREHCRFPRATAFDQISSSSRVRDELRRLYGKVDNVEFYVGLFAEDRRPNSVVPTLIGRMVGLHAFSQLLTNPLFAPEVYAGQNREKTFSRRGIEIIDETKDLSQLLHRNLPAGSPRHHVSLTREDWQRE